jgi:hypothetical protein
MKKARDPADPNRQLLVGFDAFRRRRRAVLTCVIKDPTYGTMQIYAVPPLQRTTGGFAADASGWTGSPPSGQ